MSKTHFILLYLVTAFLLVGCGKDPQYAGLDVCNPNMAALLIGEEALPSEWYRANGPPRFDDEFGTGNIDNCAICFYASNSVGCEEVFRYNTEELASDDYARLEDYFSYGNSTPLVSHDEIVADEYRIVCGRPMDTPMCNLVARYGTYVVEFNIHRSPDYMTDEDLRQAILAIDEKMTQKRE
jgi:hypothetical protein